MAVRLSCFIHGALLLLFSGCVSQVPAGSLFIRDQRISDASKFVTDVACKLPLWDSDALAPYEQPQLVIVKEDIVLAARARQTDALLKYIDRLHADWDALVALDEILRKVRLT